LIVYGEHCGATDSRNDAVATSAIYYQHAVLEIGTC
jgi:hypothetical protein